VVVIEREEINWKEKERTIAHMTDAERIDFIRADRWIADDRGVTILAELEDMLAYPQRDRMPCLLIYGATGMGKTKILRKFVREHAPKIDRSKGTMDVPVVTFQIPPLPDEGQFFEELFRALGAPAIPEGNIRRTKDACRSLLVRGGTRMLIMDETHNMLACTARQQRVFLNTLRFLANDLRIPLVCAGTDQARIALQSDAQLAERFTAMQLPQWTDNIAFRRLLNRIDAIAPLRKPAEITTRSSRKLILHKTRGITATIFKLMEDAVIKAIKTGEEQLNEELIAMVEVKEVLTPREHIRGEARL
jgi:type II secretory pathway predicted ATPase ExeA